MLSSRGAGLEADFGKTCRKFRLVKIASPKEILPRSRIRCHSVRVTQEATTLENIYLFECYV